MWLSSLPPKLVTLSYAIICPSHTLTATLVFALNSLLWKSRFDKFVKEYFCVNIFAMPPPF